MATGNKTASKKLADLRTVMRDAKVSAFIIPSSDPHLLEYGPPRFQRRAFISGFTGSAGTAVVTEESAALWTDGRYFLQAEQQLPKDWTLMKMGTPDCPEIAKWLSRTLKAGSNVGIDPFCHSEKETESLSTTLKEKEIEVVGVEQNLVDLVWGDDIPQETPHPITIHPVEIAGESVASKLARIRHEMSEVKASSLMLCKLEEIAWTLNLRGRDEECTPIFISYLLITTDSAELYVDPAKLSEDVKTYLSQMGVGVKPYDDAIAGLKQQLKGQKESKIWLDPNLCNHGIFSAAREALGQESGKRIVQRGTPLTLFMATKNEEELKGMREAHIRDAVALIEFLSWLETEIGSGHVMTEVEVADALSARRAQQKGFKGLSFPVIAGANANGAIIHYKAEAESCGSVDANTMMLIDSGGQYDCGTTDITRTFHLGTPTDYQKTCFTKVLQGHIAMATAVFPQGTPGIAIDAFARRPLWSLGLQYLHGTGHGVGAHMCVHEGPISVSFRQYSPLAQEPLKENMIVSNEPGYYEPGQFGIRIENLCVIKKQNTPYSFNDLSFLGFETISFAPIQKKLIKIEDLSPEEIAWVDSYHQEVWDKISPLISSSAKEWLRAGTAALM